MSASVKDVARQAGVSIATVSRVINSPGKVSLESARRVTAAIHKLQFRPSQAGRTLRAGRSHTIGVVVPTLSNAVFSHCMQGIETAARMLDYAVMYTTTEYRPEEELAAVEMLLRHRVDGLILTVSRSRSSRTLDRLENEGIRFVLAYNQSHRSSRASFSVDNRLAARQAVQHLIDLGHVNIRMVAGRFIASDRAMLRYQGYCDAMKANGLIATAAIESSGHIEVATGVLAPLFSARAPGRPTALFCSNDLLALNVIRSLREMGLNVPEDISVMGFDGIDAGLLMNPSLATVVQPSGEIGAAALRSLVSNLDGGASLSSQILTHEIRPGCSVAACRRPRSTTKK